LEDIWAISMDKIAISRCFFLKVLMTISMQPILFAFLIV